jgi:GT2 family glycosyltransferase
MLEDVAIDGEYFDNDFVIYREDVDLAWRAKLFGWDSYFVPGAIGYHARGFQLGRGRRSVPEELKRHSVRNGWLLLLKNDTMESIVHSLRYFVPYQLKIVGGLLTVETSSLGAIAEIARLLPTMMRKREEVQARRRRSEREMDLWFE